MCWAQSAVAGSSPAGNGPNRPSRAGSGPNRPPRPIWRPSSGHWARPKERGRCRSSEERSRADWRPHDVIDVRGGGGGEGTW